jgi:hypothetical protein
MTPFTVVSRSHFWWLPLTLLSLHSSYCWQWAISTLFLYAFVVSLALLSFLHTHCQLFNVCSCLMFIEFLFIDLSKNKLSELPSEITRFTALEKLNLYHNVIRFIPDTVTFLQCLTYLDIRYCYQSLFYIFIENFSNKHAFPTAAIS